MVTRRDLRAERDFYSPMTGDRSSTYGSQVRSRLEDIKNVKSTRTKPIEAVFAKLLKTEDPFTQIDEKKSYAPEEENDFMGALEGLGDGSGSDVAERVEEFLEPIVSGGGRSGGNALSPERRQQLSNAAIGRKSTQQLVDRDNKRYGNTFPSGSFSATDTNSMVNRDNMRYGNTFPEGSFSITPGPKPIGGQGSSVNKLGATTQRQGNTIKDGVPGSWGGPAVNASGLQQKNVRGSTSFRGTGKDESARPKQTVASLPSNYKSTEQKAFAAAKAYKSMTSGANVGSGAQANKGTGKDGGFGTGTYGSGRPSDKKTAPKKATPTQKTAVKKATTVKKSSPSPSSSGRKSNTGSKKSSRGGSKSGGSKSGGSKSGGSKSGGSKSGGSKSNSGSKSSSRGAKGSSSSRSKGGTGTGRKGQGSKRSARRCDIRCKVDISALTNLNLIKDDLADVAYFVKELQKK